MAARYHSNIAEICEGELVDFEQVSEYWTLCAVTIFHDLLSTIACGSTKVINPQIHVVLRYCMVCVRWLLHINVSVGIY